MNSICASALVLLWLIVYPSLADQPQLKKEKNKVPERILSYARASEIEREERIRIMELESKGRIVRIPSEEYRNLIDPLKPYYGHIALWKDGAELEIGEIGIVDWSRATVHHIIDHDEVIIASYLERPKYTESSTRGLMQSPTETKVWKRIWIKNIPTDKYVSGEAFSMDGVFEVIGIATYETEDRDTIPQLKRIDVTPYEDHFTLKHREKEWRDKTGEKTVRAILVRFDRDNVYLKKLDGTEGHVKVSDLSEVDRKFLRDMVKAKQKKEE